MINNRVQWSKEEWSRFLLAARFFGPPRRGDTLEVYKSAQLRAQVRPRPFDPATASKMNRARSTPLSDGSVAKAPEPAVIQPPAIEAREEHPDPQYAAPEILPPTTTIASLVLDAILSVLYDPELRKALRGLVAEALAPESELETKQAITWREHKAGERHLRVTVVGGFGSHQMTAIPGIDLRHWGAGPGESLERLRALLKGSDVAVVMVNRVPHSAVHMVKAKPNLKALYWARGIPELRPELVKLLQDAT